MDRRRFLQGLLAAGVVVLVQPPVSIPISMVAPAPKVDFEQLATTTLNRYRYILADAITSRNPRYEWLKLKGE